MAFHEVRFPDNISRGARGGPERRTQVVELASGDEERNASWANSRRRYDVAYGIRRADDLAAVVAFFESRNGRLHGFRYKDWADYKSCLPSQAVAPTDQLIGTGNGAVTTFALLKRYTSGAQSWTRAIAKPVAGTVRIALNLVEQMSGRKMPKRTVPASLALAAGVYGDIVSRVTKKRPAATREGIMLALRSAPFDSSKAKRELGYRPRPIEQAIREELEWLIERQGAPRSPASLPSFRQEARVKSSN